MSALGPDELLVAIRQRGASGAFGFEEVERRPGDFALVAAACHRGRLGAALVERVAVAAA